MEAKRASRRLPKTVEFDDLVSLGYLGLVEAAERFDPHQGTPFEAYARRRVFGRMIDAYRRRNYPRQTEQVSAEEPDPRSLEAEIIAAIDEERAVASIEILTPRQTIVLRMLVRDHMTRAEVAAHLKITPAAVSKLRATGIARLRLLKDAA